MSKFAAYNLVVAVGMVGLIATFVAGLLGSTLLVLAPGFALLAACFIVAAKREVNEGR